MPRKWIRPKLAKASSAKVEKKKWGENPVHTFRTRRLRRLKGNSPQKKKKKGKHRRSLRNAKL